MNPLLNGNYCRVRPDEQASGVAKTPKTRAISLFEKNALSSDKEKLLQNQYRSPFASLSLSTL
jgi:hypothetical protein